MADLTVADLTVRGLLPDFADVCAVPDGALDVLLCVADFAVPDGGADADLRVPVFLDADAGADLRVLNLVGDLLRSGKPALENLSSMTDLTLANDAMEAE